MASARFRAIIFDIGRVLVRIDVARALSGLAKTVSLTPEQLWSALEKHPSWRDWQGRRLQPRDFYLSVNQRFGANLTFEQFTETWNRVIAPQPILDDAFLGALAKKYRLCLLSNTDPIHAPYLEAHYHFVRHFPKRIYSFAVGVSKPNPLIFRAALEACKVAAKDAIFIDDVPAYAEAAGRLGITGIVFQSPEQLSVDLQALGVSAS